jgi:hypothetical protein
VYPGKRVRTGSQTIYYINFIVTPIPNSSLDMTPLILYITTDCHLCEEAQRVVYQALGCLATAVDIVDIAAIAIADDDQLLARYSLRIPVLRRTDTGTELDWPFGPEDVHRLCQVLPPPATA